MSLASVPRVRDLALGYRPGFPAEFREGGGSKNRCRQSKKSAIGQVLACRILTDCGEVAEGGGLLRLPGITDRA